jgi:AcrR family transcriptional regulator
MGQIPQRTDPRRHRTREALQSAFVVLALQRRYHEIRIDDILQASAVGRSTFYEHFAGKDALLVASMDDALSLLSGLPDGSSDSRRVAVLLEHFWRNRALSRSLFQGAPLRIVRRALVAQVESRLARFDGGRLRLPPRLAAHALADGVFSPIVAWLAGEAGCGADELAAALRASSQAALAGMVAASDRS